MKNRIVMFLLLLSTVIYAQNWTAVKETNINVSSALSVDIFTNGYGNHIIVQESNSLKYYKMDVNGTVGTPITLESTTVVSPSISGDATKLYIVYRKSNETFIRIKYSSDGGSTWSYITNLNYNASYIESVFSNNKLHVTYEVSNVIYYSYYNALNSTWSPQTTVSTGENGNNPRITAWFDSNDDKVYFLYKKSNSNESKWREYNITNGSWGSINPAVNVSQSSPVGFRVDDTRVYVYYTYYAQDPFGQWFNFLNWIVLNKSNNSTLNTGTPDINLTNKLYSATTNDGNTHTAFLYTWLLDSDFEIGIWRSDINSGYPSDLIYEYQSLSYFPYHLNLSSGGNDVYVIWKDVTGTNPTNLKFSYDDQTPLTPTGFSGTTYNDHPQFSWDLINGPDVVYEIWRRITPRHETGTWALLTTVSASQNSYTDNGIQLSGTPAGIVEYKIRAKDQQPAYSGYTNTISYTYSGINKISIGNSPDEYRLIGNFPNPFNPSTLIKYQLPKSSFVSLKVFDVLGREVANLVNENQSEGTYSIEFNAVGLESGVYIYQLRTKGFVQSNKMILMK